LFKYFVKSIRKIFISCEIKTALLPIIEYLIIYYYYFLIKCYSGISSLGFSRQGEGMFCLSSSELQRISVGARRVTQPLCWLPRTFTPAVEDMPRVNGDATSESGSKKGTSHR
jgi:hypothetical protein